MHKLIKSMGAIVAVLSSKVFAAQELNFTPGKTLEFMLNQGVQNRLQVKKGFLLEIVGDENKYSITWGTDGQNVFLTPKVDEGETVDLSLITVGGKAQDLRFTVIDEGAESVVINMAGDPSAENDSQDKVAIAALFRAMLTGDAGKYYVVKNAVKLESTLPKVSMTQETFYAGKGFIGAIVKIINSSSKPIAIQESDFNDIYVNTLAVNLQAHTLRPHASAAVLIVAKR